MMFYDKMTSLRCGAWCGAGCSASVSRRLARRRPFCRGSRPFGRDGGIGVGCCRGRLRSRSSQLRPWPML